MTHLRFIYPPTIDWEGADVFQRPQQLMRAFARAGHEAIFLERSSDGEMRECDGVQIYSNWPNFFGHTDGPTILWVTHAPHFRMKDYYTADILVFDYIDEAADEFAHWTTDLKEAMEAADIITVVSDRLLGIIQSQFPDKPVLLSPNAADFEHFKDAKKTLCPFDMASIWRPAVGFMGTLQSWIDMDLLDELTNLEKNMSFIFIGPDYANATTRIGHKPNVHMLGRKKYDELPFYVGQFSVGIIPFQVRDMTNSSSPIKMYEYLAAGVPVVSTPIQEAVECKQVITATTPEEWSKALRQAIDSNSPDVNQEYAKRESWDSRVKDIINALERITK